VGLPRSMDDFYEFCAGSTIFVESESVEVLRLAHSAALQSPYELHKNLLLDDTYATARRQDFVLHQYECGRYPNDINECIGGFDSKHL